MSPDLQVLLRTPTSYDLAQAALDELKRLRVWPTVLNLEIWLHALAQPDGVLNQEIQRLIQLGEPITEALSEELALSFLPSRALSNGLIGAGDELCRQLDGVAHVIEEAQRASATYGRALAGATQEMQQNRSTDVGRLVRNLSQATQLVQSENAALEQRLNESTREVRRLKESLELVRHDALTDALTNLANRKAFDTGLAQAVVRASAEGGDLTLAILDIDHFKAFNDTWGHQTGDQIIRFVASVLERLGVAPRLAARYGGEEFTVIFPGESLTKAQRLLQQVLDEISGRQLKRRSTNEVLGAVTISAGVAQWSSGETAAGLIERADEALYASKRGGRNRVTVANEPLAAVA